MSTIPHVCEYQYSEPKTVIYSNCGVIYKVIRFCKDCLEYEELELKEKNKE